MHDGRIYESVLVILQSVMFLKIFWYEKIAKIALKVLYKAFYDFSSRENVNIRDKIFHLVFYDLKIVSLQQKNQAL